MFVCKSLSGQGQGKCLQPIWAPTPQQRNNRVPSETQKGRQNGRIGRPCSLGMSTTRTYWSESNFIIYVDKAH